MPRVLGTMSKFTIGQPVVKSGGAYAFDGTVRAVFTNEAGETRLVVESHVIPNLLHIFSPNQVHGDCCGECYWCTSSRERECRVHGGFDSCCADPACPGTVPSMLAAAAELEEARRDEVKPRWRNRHRPEPWTPDPARPAYDPPDDL